LRDSHALRDVRLGESIAFLGLLEPPTKRPAGDFAGSSPGYALAHTATLDGVNVTQQPS